MMPHVSFKDERGTQNASECVIRMSHFLFLNYILYLLKYNFNKYLIIFSVRCQTQHRLNPRKFFYIFTIAHLLLSIFHKDHHQAIFSIDKVIILAYLFKT